jgi:death-on-curing protein
MKNQFLVTALLLFLFASMKAAPFRYVAAMLMIAIAKGHIFNDGNKRTALMATLYFLFRNDVKLKKSNQLEDWTVEAAIGTLTVSSLALNLKSLSHHP